MVEEAKATKTFAELVKEGRDNSRAFAVAYSLKLPLSMLNGINDELIRITQRWLLTDLAERGPK